MIRAYASRTGTRRNLDGLRSAGWGLLISAYGVHRDEGFDDIMLDPGTWSTRAGDHWDERKFVDLLDRFGRKSAQTIAPDVVAGGRSSLDLSLSWLADLVNLGRPVLVAAQDGMCAADLLPLLSDQVGIAVGGTTRWKWDTASMWCRVASEAGARCHILRANSQRMIRFASSIGASSFDGSGPSLYAQALPIYDAGRGPTTRTLPLDLPAPFFPKEKKL